MIAFDKKSELHKLDITYICIYGRAIHSPCFGVTRYAEERQNCHTDSIEPSEYHNLAGQVETQSFIEVYGVGDGVPPFQCYNSQRYNRQFWPEHCQKPGHLTTQTCKQTKNRKLTWQLQRLPCDSNLRATRNFWKERKSRRGRSCRNGIVMPWKHKSLSLRFSVARNV